MSPVAPEYGITQIWFGGLAQAVGLPIAWLRVRGTDAWRNRPSGVRRVDLLAEWIRTPTEVTLLWTFLMLLVLIGALLLDWPGIATLAAVLLVAFPLLIVPLMVLSLDVRHFEHLVERLSRPFEDIPGGAGGGSRPA